jgi:CheY-like chemotaxis protein
MATILVIDDEPTIRMLVRISLERRRHRVLEAAEGLTGLEVAAGAQPDLILLDMALPQMSGLEVAKHLQSSTPVLLLTGLAPECDAEGDLGPIRGFVAKPFNPAELVTQIEELLESEAERLPEPAPAA